MFSCKCAKKKNVIQDINYRPFSIFVDEATGKAGKISYFGKHQKIVTIFGALEL